MRYVFEDYELDTQLFELRHNGQLLKLEPQEFNVLAYLIEHHDKIVTKEELLEQVWPDQFVSEATLSQRIMTLRKALGESGRSPRCIKTIHGRGYRFVAALSSVTPEMLPDARQMSSLTPACPSPSQTLSESSSELDDIEGQTSLPQVPVSVTPQPIAERRQLTILFCDLVGSTLLSEQLDPEDLDEVLQAYYAACDEAIKSFGGHVAQYLGDGLLVYFGYPLAQEDAARRAAHAGLDVLQVMSTLNRRLETDYGLRLDVRIGIHTGLVIIGSGRSEGRAEELAVGATPNIASRIQSLTAPNTVLVSESTRALISGYFALDDMGPHELQGVAEPMQLYRVVSSGETQHRLDVSGANRLTPLVGRELERLVLQEHWDRVRRGQGQVVLLSGEAGIGKSRLSRVLVEMVSENSWILLEGHASPYHQHTAFYAIVDLLQRLLNIHRHSTTADKRNRLLHLVHQYQLEESAAIPLLASLLDIQMPENEYPGLELSPQQQRQHTMEVLLTLVTGLSNNHPVLLFIEDGHWLDPSTLEWFNLLVDQGPILPIFTLVTCRPEFQASWSNRAHVTSLTLKPLPEPQIAQMVQSLASDSQTATDWVDQIIKTTDGVPLFVEEMTNLLITTHAIAPLDAGITTSIATTGLPIPATLQDLLMARLDASQDAKRTAQLGATIGREFSYDLLREVSPLAEPDLHQDLSTLLKLDLLYQRGFGRDVSYLFKHALIQEAAYTSQLVRTRQQQHHNIARALEAEFRGNHEGNHELIAHHYTEAGDLTAAIPFWLRAGVHAAQHSAHEEAVVHLSRGIGLVQQLPISREHQRQELSLQVALGSSLYTLNGFADSEFEQVYLRARTLCQQLDETEPLFPVLRGLSLLYVCRGALKTAEETALELLDLVAQETEVGPQMLGHYAITVPLFLSGQGNAAKWHAEQVIATYQTEVHRDLIHTYGVDIGVAAHSFMSLTLWSLGYPEQALGHGRIALKQAQLSNHPFSLVTAQTWLAWLHHFRRESTESHARATESNILAEQQGFSLYVAYSRAWQGWGLAAQGHHLEGVAAIQDAISATLAIETTCLRPYHLAMIADVLNRKRQWQEGLDSISEALKQIRAIAGYWWEAEIHRLQGELLLLKSRDNGSQAIESFTRALQISRSQSSKSLELRAATSLSRLWKWLDKKDEARDLLAPIYHWFTEGFDTADLREAKELLEELAVDHI